MSFLFKIKFFEPSTRRNRSGVNIGSGESMQAYAPKKIKRNGGGEGDELKRGIHKLIESYNFTHNS